MSRRLNPAASHTLNYRSGDKSRKLVSQVFMFAISIALTCPSVFAQGKQFTDVVGNQMCSSDSNDLQAEQNRCGNGKNNPQQGDPGSHTSHGGDNPGRGGGTGGGSNYGGGKGSSYGGDSKTHQSPPYQLRQYADANVHATSQHPLPNAHTSFASYGGENPDIKSMSGNYEKKEKPNNKMSPSNSRGSTPLVDTAHVAQPHSSDLGDTFSSGVNKHNPDTNWIGGASNRKPDTTQLYAPGGGRTIDTVKLSQPTTINLGGENVGTRGSSTGVFPGVGLGPGGGSPNDPNRFYRNNDPLGRKGGAFDHEGDPRHPIVNYPKNPRQIPPITQPNPRTPPRVSPFPPDDGTPPFQPPPSERNRPPSNQPGGSGGGNFGSGGGVGTDTIPQPHMEPHPSAAGSSSFQKTDGVQKFVNALGATGDVAGRMTGGGLAATAAGAAAVMANKMKGMPGADAGQSKANQNAQKQSGADNLAAMERYHAACALEWVRSFLENFTTEGGNKWNRVRDKLFVPIAILLLLPGAVICQVKSIASQGFVVLGEIQPFEGIFRSIIGIFLIPATYLVVNYGIDIANSLTETIATSYRQLFGTDMYQDAFCGHIRAFPIREPEENPGQITNQEAQMFNYFGNTPLARLEGKTLSIKYDDPCVGLYIVPPDRNNDNVPYMVNEQRLAYNQANAAFTMAWVILCAVQQAYLYYLWFVGPVIAACWVYPSRQLREAFPSWIEGVVTLCCWSLFWSVAILLMACFHGVDDTGTIMFTALNFLTIGAAKFAFDFTGLVKDAGREAMSMAQKAAQAAAKGGGGGGGGGKGGGGSPGNKGGEKGSQEGPKKEGPSPMATAQAHEPAAGRREAAVPERPAEQPRIAGVGADAGENTISSSTRLAAGEGHAVRGGLAPRVEPPPKTAGLTGDQAKPVVVASTTFDIDHDNSTNPELVRPDASGGDPAKLSPGQLAKLDAPVGRAVTQQGAPPESAAARAAAQQRADAEAADKRAGKQMTAEERAAADKAKLADDAAKAAKPVDGVIVTASLAPGQGLPGQTPGVQAPVDPPATFARGAVPGGDDTIKPAPVQGDHGPPVVRAREGVGDVHPTQIAAGPDPNAVQAAVDRARNSIDPNSFMTAMNTGSAPSLPDPSGINTTFTGAGDTALSRDSISSYIAGAEQDVVSIDYDDVVSYETAASQPLQSSYGSYASQSVDAATEQYLSANAGVIEGQAQQAAQQAAMQAQAYQKQQMSPQEEQAYQQAYEQQSKQQEASRQAAQQLNEQRQKELREQSTQRARDAAQGGQRAANALGAPRSGLPAGSGQPGSMGRGQSAQGGGPRRLLSRGSGPVRKDLKGNVIQPPAGAKGTSPVMNGAPGMIKPGAGGVSEHSKQQAAADWTSGLSIANLKRRARTIKKQTEAEKAADLDALKKMQQDQQ